MQRTDLFRFPISVATVFPDELLVPERSELHVHPFEWDTVPRHDRAVAEENRRRVASVLGDQRAARPRVRHFAPSGMHERMMPFH